MNMNWVDWVIIVVLVLLLNGSAWFCRRFMKGVNNFLVAGRSVGRYLGLSADAMQVGAITILAGWQFMYKAGFSAIWWGMMGFPLSILIAFSGFGIYRWRQSRAMTLGQLIEMRYSRRFRIFFGILAFLSGIVNMGIFPVIGANFFVFFCGLPRTVALMGMQVPTFIVIMLFLESLAVGICLMGGRVTLVVTDFLQGLFVNVILMVIVVIIWRMISWDRLMEAYLAAPNAAALIHPFHTGGMSEFNIGYFLLQLFWPLYLVVVWAPNAMQLGSAKDAHEARMMKLIGYFKGFMGVGLGLTVIPLAAFVMMHHPSFAEKALQVNSMLAGIDNPHEQSQMIVPAAIALLLPHGILGMFAAVVLFAHVATNNAYYLTWGSMFVQDVLNPLLGRRINPERHLLWLRLAVLGVALFVIAFSLLFRQADNIVMFQAISGAIFTSGAGVVVLAALYWNRGTVRAAWWAMIVGAGLSLAGMILRSVLGERMLNGQWMAFWACIAAVAVFLGVSLLERRDRFDTDRMLNREAQAPGKKRRHWWQGEVPMDWSDKLICAVITGEAALVGVAFVVVCIINILQPAELSTWANVFKTWLYFNFFSGVVILTWISLGGFRDLARMFRALDGQETNEHDDGSVGELKPAMHEAHVAEGKPPAESLNPAS